MLKPEEIIAAPWQLAAYVGSVGTRLMRHAEERVRRNALEALAEPMVDVVDADAALTAPKDYQHSVDRGLMWEHIGTLSCDELEVLVEDNRNPDAPSRAVEGWDVPHIKDQVLESVQFRQGRFARLPAAPPPGTRA